MSRALDVVTLTGAEYDALTQRADDWYTLYARAAKERTAALEDVERWKKAAESNIEENVGLRLAEEGAKEAFAHVVQQKRDFEAECKRLRGLLDGAHDNLHPLFVAVLHPFSPAPILIESSADEATEEKPTFADDREDYGYEMQRQSRIDSAPDAEFQIEIKEH